MFSSIKDTLLTVKRNVNIFNTNDKNNVQSDGNKINLEAGSKLLGYFESHWSTLHVVNEENAQLADQISTIITEISTKINRDKEDLDLMTHIIVNSNLTQNITNCTNHIEQLYKTFDDIEKELVQLENVIECLEFENEKKEHSYHLKQYKLRKQESLSSYEKKIQEQYEKEIADMEEKKKRELEERQQVFQEAFKNDLEMFKNFGTIPKLDLPKQQSALLEEIQVEYDETELNQFFEASPPSQ